MDTKREHLPEEYEQGKSARKKLIPISSNPYLLSGYLPTSYEVHSWNAGWSDADMDIYTEKIIQGLGKTVTWRVGR